MSRWEKAGYNGEAAIVRAGRDVCMATVSPTGGLRRGFSAVSHVNYNDPSSRRMAGWAASRDYTNRADARRDALRACGRMLRALNK